jgi:transglutaminase-like putative cysteine protease
MADETLGDLIEMLGSIDHHQIDWDNIQKASFLIHQRFRYDYPGPIGHLRQRLMVVPPDFHDDQRLITHKVRIGAVAPSFERSFDTFGNVVLDVSVDRVESFVEFDAWIVVEREATPVDAEEAPDAVWPDNRLLAQTRLTRRGPGLEEAATAIRGERLEGDELAERIMGAVHEHFRYAFGATTVLTGAEEAWQGGAGVCQDYAHCMIAIARGCGLPARYVSGHLLGEGGTHAWVEVLVPHPSQPEMLRAVAFDPTNDRRPGLKYLTVAVGRDYADVPPTSGTFVGPHQGMLDTYKQAVVTRVEYVRPRRALRRVRVQR